jgi:hypothetical protein
MRHPDGMKQAHQAAAGSGFANRLSFFDTSG